jgi:tryptophan 2,3-dioxygenase
MTTELTYARYLEVEALLALQKPRSDPPEHDELLFIVIHQVYELWFKLLLHELDKVRRDFAAGDVFGAIATFKRARTVMKTLVGQLDILETMTPLSFSAFRARLDTSSGFQSAQFRELEFVLGYKRPEVLQHIPEPTSRERARRRLDQASVVDAFQDFLAQRGVARGEPLEVQEGILRLYRSHPELGILFELMLDLDEGFQEWRYRHVKIVERTIGAKLGTGGSPGVEFLKRSLFQQAFPDLWAVRHRM